MTKQFILVVTLFMTGLANISGQVGIKTQNPHPSSDLELGSTNKAFIFNRVPKTADILNPINGMMIYDLSNECFKGYANNAWTDCLGKSSSPVVEAVCNGFTGTYKSGTALSGATYTVNVTNNSFSTASISFSASDLALNGMSGITVASVSPTTANLIAGQSQLITYTLTGTPGSCGTLTGSWTKLSLNCTKTTNVASSPTFNCAGGSWSTVSPAYKLDGLMSGQSYTGTYSVPYTNGGCGYTSETITQSGLTLTLDAGNYGATGNLTYALSGTYTGTDHGSVTFTTVNGCTIYLGPCQTCKDILDRGLASTDGVYWIDIDQAGTTYGSMQAQCDMTTDGGGWTLISNYTRTGNNGTFPTQRTSLPLIIGGLGTNEAGNSTTWGQINSTMVNTIPFTEIRWSAEGGYYPSDVWDIKTSLSTNITALKANTVALTNNFIKLPAHNVAGYPEGFNRFHNTPMVLGAGRAFDTSCSGSFIYYKSFVLSNNGSGQGINSEYRAGPCPTIGNFHGSSAFIRTYIR